MLSIDDTIAAIATARGPAGLAVVRVSGSDAIAAVEAVFRSASPIALAPSHTLHHGWIVTPWPSSQANGVAQATHPAHGLAGAGSGAPIDEVVVALFRAPRSYTREDVVEISCHGGDWPARRVLEAILGSGARLAQPGEFTFRAFLNGRIDLAQAEAVADLIHAATDRAREVALAQLAGELSKRISSLGERVANAAAEVEARVDFAEDVGGVEVPEHVVGEIEALERDLEELLAGGRYARALREGVSVPIVGRPNVGKSSLFNALLGESRAIVTPIAGTTRDRVSESLEVAGIPVRLCDTAGLRESVDPVEAIGVSLAEEELESGAVVLWVVDGSVALQPEDLQVASRLGGRRVAVAINKSDQPERVRAPDVLGLWERFGHHAGDAAVDDGKPSRAVVKVSALGGQGVPELRRVLADLLGAGGGETALAAQTGNPRHREALERARAALERAARAARSRMPGEIVAMELRESWTAFGEVTGWTASEDLLERIFARFCVGK